MDHLQIDNVAGGFKCIISIWILTPIQSIPKMTESSHCSAVRGEYLNADLCVSNETGRNKW